MSAPSLQPHRDSRFVSSLILIAILAASFFLKLNHLGHASIKALDESFHALVAKNLLKHPFTPTLYDQPWLPYDYRAWQANHIWLHKPIVPPWQMALSMKLLGTTPLALRLPSALLATAAVWLTYAIGFELLGDRLAALIAAALQAINPAITALVHGYVFSDHIDIAFLFWVELAIFFLARSIRTGSTRFVLAAGVAQGVAFLCKTYPAFIVTGIALVALWLDRSIKPRQLLWLVLATILTIMPWCTWCLIEFPREFVFEQLQVFRHLGTNVENWAAPWDRLLFDYLLNVYHVLYPAVIVAIVLLAPLAVLRERLGEGSEQFASADNRSREPGNPHPASPGLPGEEVVRKRSRAKGILLLYAWAFGVLIPHLLATSKTPSATLIGWPAFFLILGVMISRGVAGDRWCLGGWFAAALLAAIVPGTIGRSGFGYPVPPNFGVIARQNIWVVFHVIAALILAAALLRVAARWRRGLVVIASLATLVVGTRITQSAWRITERNLEQPTFADLAALLNPQLPPNAVLLLEIREKSEHIMAMFWLNRSVYPVAPETVAATAREVRRAGGEPFLLTNRAVPLPPLIGEFVDGLHVYALPAAAMPAIPAMTAIPMIPATNPTPAPTTSP